MAFLTDYFPLWKHSYLLKFLSSTVFKSPDQTMPFSWLNFKAKVQILSITCKDIHDFTPIYLSSLTSLYFIILWLQIAILPASCCSTPFYLCLCFFSCQDSFPILQSCLFIKIQLRYHLFCEVLPNDTHTSSCQSGCKISAPLLLLCPHSIFYLSPSHNLHYWNHLS